jgi:hypothetical protein
MASYRVMFSGLTEPGTCDWLSNHFRFPSEEEARSYGTDIASRWPKVKAWKVVPAYDPINTRWANGRLETSDGNLSRIDT